MKSIARLFTAFATLAGSLEALATLIDITGGRLRQSLALEAPEGLEQLPAPEESGKRKKAG